MAIQFGTRLGPYEVLSAIGAGGMGEVYRARDTRLQRDVAIKVLPSHLADDPQKRERFEREARTIASLNHPHICTLHDVGHQDGTDFLVMEYVEGETLATRLLKGVLPLDHVLRNAIEIADALDKAHRKGITHRDIKPGNIMLTKNGVKLLDFGLAKLKQDIEPVTPMSQLPTLTHSPTAEGMILGTLQYMAPEQVEGKVTEIDARTDIFAFGVVIYEMATGKKAFEGKTSASLMAKILEVDPPSISTLQPMTPPALDRVVKRCLAKEPDERWQTASDLREELKWILKTQAEQAPSSRRELLKNVRLSWAPAGAMFAALLILGFFYFRRVPETALPIRFYLSPPQSWNLTQQLGSSRSAPVPLAVSPDGRRIAFLATSAEGKTQLWVRSLDTIESVALAGTDGAARPFWSPDSRYLAFFADRKLKKIDVAGGPPITLCDAPDDRSGTWSKDGVIVFAPMAYGPLQKVSASGGTPTPASILRADETAHRRPFFLPDGRHFIFRAITSQATSGPFFLGSLDSTDRKLFLTADTGTIAYSQGHVLFLRGTTLMAQPFDAKRLDLAGDAFPIAENILIQSTAPGFGVFSASLNGLVAYQTGAGPVGTRLSWLDRAGKEIGVLGDSTPNTDLQLSPDAKRVSVGLSDQSGNRDIWIYDVSRGVRTRFTFDPADELASVWSPDGTRVILNSRRKGHLDLYQKSSNGAGSEQLVFEDGFEKYPNSWSPDGKSLLYTSIQNGKTTGYDLYILPLSADSVGVSRQALKPLPFLETRFDERTGQFSPDGRWIAYASDESGRLEVYVAPFSGAGGKWQVSTNGGGWPRWRHDGSEIFYLTPDNKMMAAEVSGRGGSFEIGQTKTLFVSQQMSSATLNYSYDVSPDGQQFLVNSIPVQASTAPITVVADWTAGLKK